jgi:hypothetical protein
VPAIEVMVTTSGEAPRLEDRRVINVGQREVLPPAHVDLNVARHDALLRRLAEHPLVRRIGFPILIESTEAPSPATPQSFPLTSRVVEGKYPKVGVIDTGGSGANWVNAA